MRLLLDTHALIWALEDSPLLSERVRLAIQDANSEILASAVSVWEISIKMALGKLEAPDDLEEAIEDVGFTKLPLTFAPALALRDLPPHHKDPFDRMLVAQALCEGVPIITSDRQISYYQVQVFW